MGKIVVIGLILVVLLFLITRKLSKFKYDNTYPSTYKQQQIEITVPTFILQQVFKKNLITVGTGILILLITIAVGSKFKIALILLPICFYLIGQFFVFNNHIRAIKKQRAIFDQANNVLTVKTGNNKTVALNLSTDRFTVKEVKAVQKNNGILMGFFELTTPQGSCFIPYLLAENKQTIPLFNKLEKFQRVIETKIFPII